MKKPRKNIPPAHIHPRAIRNISLRLLPEMRTAIEEEAQLFDISLTKVVLAALEAFFSNERTDNQTNKLLIW